MFQYQCFLRMLLALLGVVMVISGVFKIKPVLYFFAKYNLFYDLFGLNGVRVTTILLGLVFIFGWAP